MLNGLNKTYSLGAIEEFKLKAVKSIYVSITKTFYNENLCIIKKLTLVYQ